MMGLPCFGVLTLFRNSLGNDFTTAGMVYCKTTNFSVLLILAILANGIKTLILIPANNYNQSHGRTR